ncbi:hypothetical protein [Enterococcus sp. CSURQ0835]|uniref:hypothetical protein n=1 Tax=Enterococcus sp. CSURQ0835 TaxID=2681394 RepID=UPI00135A1B9C|nr:hypothetical protein [Enterococcus sp. CSURQ0835]
MKTVSWVWSLNRNDQLLGAPIETVNTFHPYRFQREFPKVLGNDWHVAFITWDLVQTESPHGEVIVIVESLKRFVDFSNASVPVVVIPVIEMMRQDYQAIATRILSAVH